MRLDMLGEAIDVMRELWKGSSTTHRPRRTGGPAHQIGHDLGPFLDFWSESFGDQVREAVGRPLVN